MSNIECCIKIFKPILEEYKNNKNKQKNSYKNNDVKEKNNMNELLDKYTTDYLMVKDLQNSFKTLGNIIRYLVIKNDEYYNDLLKEYKPEEIQDMKINLPKNNEELISLYIKYPDSMECINEELYEIVNMKDYGALLALNRINLLFYYSVVTEATFAEEILYFSYSIDKFKESIMELVKKLKRDYIELIVLKTKKEKGEKKEEKKEENKTTLKTDQ